MLKQNRSRTFACALLLALTLGSCSSATTERTVQMQANYPSYDERSLIKEATLIVEGTVLAAENTVLMPQYEGDTPEENPLVGLTEDEKKQAIEQDEGVAATAVTIRVDVAHQGSAKQGQEITVFQTGGVINNVEYKVDGEVKLVVGQSYLLFAADSRDRAFYILGGSAGTYLSTGDGVFTAVSESVAPFKELSSADVERITR